MPTQAEMHAAKLCDLVWQITPHTLVPIVLERMQCLWARQWPGHAHLDHTSFVPAADVTANPAIASGVILFALALALSPYVLVIGGAVLVFSLGSLPEPFKKLLPPPVAQVSLESCHS